MEERILRSPWDEGAHAGLGTIRLSTSLTEDPAGFAHLR